MRRLRLPVAGLIVALSPGFTAYEAFASGLKSGAGAPVSVSGINTGGALNLPAIPGLPSSAIQTGLNVPAASILPAVSIPGQVLSPSQQVPGAVQLPVPGVLPEAVQPAGALPALQQTAQELAQRPGGEAGALEKLFTGRKAEAGVVGDGSGLGGGAPAGSGLSAAPSLESLEAKAADQSKPRAERSEAVKALAKLKTDASREALRRVGTGTPATTADDYEVKREALKALAEQGVLVSLPPVSRAHAEQILQDLSGAKKPAAAAFDYDSTLEASGTPISKETAEKLEALAKSGVETLILTDRAPLSRRVGDVGMDTTLASLTPSQKSLISVATNRGAQIWISGMSRDAVRSKAWTNEETVALNGAGMELERKYGKAEVDHEKRVVRGDYDYARFLPAGTPEATVDEAAAFMKSELERRGVKAAVTPRYAGGIETFPYVTVSKYDKSHGVLGLRRLREHLGRLRDVERLPRFLQGAARALISVLPKGSVPASSVLLVGDHFFGPRGIDADMAKGAPGALSIAVGGTADPRIDNVFVWDKKGHEASMELAAAASAPAAPQLEGLDKKAAWGLFLSRSFSIIAFLGTTLAHAKLTYSIVDAKAFGTIAALGALAAIAAGPLLGKVADKMSPRKGMSINTIMRGVLLLDLPLFAALGILNFWTLLLGALANGFLLSSILTSESAYLRRLFGFKNLGTMNSLLQLNYFGLQIVFGLLLGIGKLVDGHDLMIPFYIASAANFFLVLPIIRRTMPNTTQAQADPTLADAVPNKVERGGALPRAVGALKSFAKKYWKEILLFGAALASFPFLGSALPITASLAWWVTRTEGFSLFTKDKGMLKALLLVALGAFMLYSTQSFLIPTMAKILGGTGSALLNGKMLGALFLGQMISTSTLAKLPVVRLPFIGRFGLHRVIQGVVLGMLGAWVYFSLIPGSVLAVGAALAVAAAMMAGGSRLTDKGWLSLVGVGLGSLLIPAFFWGAPAALLAGLVAFGYFMGPMISNLFAYVGRRAPANQVGAVFGVQGSLFNAAISLGIGSVSLLAGLFTPSFPPTLLAVGLLGLAAGAVYFLVARTMPGLSAGLFKSKEESK